MHEFPIHLMEWKCCQLVSKVSSPEACGVVVAVMSGSRFRGTGNFVTLCPDYTPITPHLCACLGHVARYPPGSRRTRAFGLGSIPVVPSEGHGVGVIVVQAFPQPLQRRRGACDGRQARFLVPIRSPRLKSNRRCHFGVLGPSRLFEGLLCDMILPNVSIVSDTVCIVA